VKKLMRIALLSVVAFGVASTADSNPAFAYYKHHHKHAKHAHHGKVTLRSKSNTMVREGQNSLINLNYLHDKADGVLGHKTMKAVKAFQHDAKLPMTGQIDKATYSALIKADKSRAMAALPIPASSLLPKNLTMPGTESKQETLPAQPGLVGPTDQQYADPLLSGVTVAGDGKGAPQAVRTQELSSRYAKLDINENKNGNLRRYNMTVNGNPVLQIDNQPSIIGISETFALDHEDALILTAYNENDKVCSYKHYLLILADKSTVLHAIGNCTHGYQARKTQDSIFVTFPEVDDQRVAGATWRYEGGELVRL
jgi:hypothetical protein